MLEDIPDDISDETEAPSIVNSHYDYLRIKAEVLPDRTRQVEYISIDGIQRPKKVTRDWIQVRELGSGGHGVVWMERANDGALRAVKHLQKSQRVTSYLQELLTMTKLSKDNVFFVQLHGWFESDRNVHIAMEYFPFGDLSTCFHNPLAEGLVKKIGEQLLEGLARMHELGITHRDLKPQNIFVAQVDPIWVKIGDFGISKLVSDDGTALRTSRVGTHGFQAPEVLRLLDDAPETSEYTHAVDIWSLGCVLYALKCQHLPFSGGSLWGYCQGYGGFPESPLRSSGMKTAGLQFLNGLLAVDPRKRPSAASALQSPWILQYDDLSDDMKQAREERPESTAERVLDTPMSIKNLRIINFPSLSRSERDALARIQERNADISKSTRPSKLRVVPRDMSKQQSNPRRGQRFPVNPGAREKSDGPGDTLPKAQDDHLQLSTPVALADDDDDNKKKNAGSQIAALSPSEPVSGGSSPDASDDKNHNFPAVKSRKVANDMEETASGGSQSSVDGRRESKIGESGTSIFNIPVDTGQQPALIENESGNVSRTNDHTSEEQRFANPEADSLPPQSLELGKTKRWQRVVRGVVDELVPRNLKFEHENQPQTLAKMALRPPNSERRKLELLQEQKRSLEREERRRMEEQEWRRRMVEQEGRPRKEELEERRRMVEQQEMRRREEQEGRRRRAQEWSRRREQEERRRMVEQQERRPT
ncbi:MAG: hypothetical protein Q9195_009021 [Heterodermia aff. obscurata]